MPTHYTQQHFEKDFACILNPRQKEQLEAYAAKVIEFNQGLNLVSLKSAKDLWARHFADSVLAWKGFLESPLAKKASGSNKEKVFWDLGSGAGFPAVVWAICGNGTWNLVEADERKAEFLCHVVSFLHLKNLQVHCKRVEQIHTGQCKWATSRAMAPLQKTLKYSWGLMAQQGVLLLFKSAGWEAEARSLSISTQQQWQLQVLKTYSLPYKKPYHSLVAAIKIQ